MMSRDPARAHCPSDEALAAFAEARLPAADRDGLAAHLADCARCRELVSFTVTSTRDVSERRVLGFPRRWLSVGALAAAAVVMAFGAAVWPRLRPPSDAPELAGLVAALGAARPIEPRLTGGFAYGPVPRVTRGAPASVTPEVQVATARIEKADAERSSAASRRARAAALLVGGRAEEAVVLLGDVTRAHPDDARAWNDLAAALLVRGHTTDDGAALDAADRALVQRPDLREALFNRALAVQRLRRPDEARAAWDRYLAVDASSGWAGEARERRGAPAPPRSPGP